MFGDFIGNPKSSSQRSGVPLTVHSITACLFNHTPGLAIKSLQESILKLVVFKDLWATLHFGPKNSTLNQRILWSKVGPHVHGMAILYLVGVATIIICILVNLHITLLLPDTAYDMFMGRSSRNH